MEPYVIDARPETSDSFDVVPRNPDLATLQSLFGFTIRREFGEERAASGEAYWKLAGFLLREGIATYIPKVLDQAGAPLASILVFRRWPTADPFPAKINPPYHQNGVGGWTNAEGDVGFGYGGGSVVVDGQGIDAIWVSADPPGGERMHSDCVDNLGWFGGTDHLTPQPIFQVAVKDVVGPPSGEARLVVYGPGGGLVGFVPLQTGAGQGGRIVLEQGGVAVGYATMQEMASLAQTKEARLTILEGN